MLSPPKDALHFGAYARADEHRLAGVRIQRDQPSIWSTLDPYPVRKQQLRRHDRVVLLVKANRTADCPWSPQDSPGVQVGQCLPRPFHQGYRVDVAEAGGTGWNFAVLRRDPSTCGTAGCDQ